MYYSHGTDSDIIIIISVLVIVREPITRTLLTWNTLASFWMLSNVYLSERRWRILKSREPRLDISDSSSSMMSWGVLSFFPRSMARPPGAQQAPHTAYYTHTHAHTFLQKVGAN